MTISPLERFYDFMFYKRLTFSFMFAVLLCLIITPLNLKLIDPIQKKLDIPTHIEVKDRACVSQVYCIDLGTTSTKSTNPYVYAFICFIELSFGFALGYEINNFLVKKLF